MILFKINKKKLIYILNIINLIVEKKTTNKDSENVIIIIKKNKIYFIITDNIILLKKKIKIKKNLKKNITIFFSIKNFTKIIKNLPECNIKIIYKKKKIIIKKKNINYSFKVKKNPNYNYNEYKKKYIKFIIEKKNLINLLDSVYFIINKDINQKNTLLLIKNNYIKIVSADNYRYICDKIKIKNVKNVKNIVIPNKTLQVLYKIIKLEKEEKILIKFNKFQIKFKIKNLQIISKIIDNNYPVIKNNKNKWKNNFNINKKELQMSLKRSKIITEKENFSKWIINKNNLKIITKWNSNKGKEIININYSGKKIVIGVDNNHILELIVNIKSDKLIFNFSKKNKNIIILDPEKINFKYITTSINLKK